MVAKRYNLALSPAEEEVLALMADALTIREVAEERRTSYATARTQLERIKAKAGVRRNRDLVVVARRYFKRDSIV